MNPDIRSTWAARLRRPGYVPNKGSLRNSDDGTMCPLGELCELHRLATGNGHWSMGRYWCGPGDTAVFGLPRGLIEWAGLTSFVAYPQLGRYNISEWNDGAEHGTRIPFPPAMPEAIAEMIEEYL